MKIEFKDPNLIAKIGDFMRNYLVSVRNRDDDTILSYKYSVNLYLQFLKEVFERSQENQRNRYSVM